MVANDEAGTRGGTAPVVKPMIRTLKKSVGFLTRLTINHAITSATKQRPSRDKKAGRCRLRSASAEVDSVRASTASAEESKTPGRAISALPARRLCDY